MNNTYKYHAFISYSHQDKKSADWLHKSLETYKIPSSLIGTENKDGDLVSSKLTPIFRDREELPVRADLGEVITAALQSSNYLILICSPNSSQSMWVNKEIIDFKRMHGENKVLAIIVDGEPNATDKPDKFDPALEAFPEALRHKVNKEALSDTTESLEAMLESNLSKDRTEPLAADAREIGDGKERAKVKLIAGLLGVGFDELWDREKRRKKQRLIALIALVTTIFLVISTLGIFSFIQMKKAEEKEVEAVQSERIAIQKEKEALESKNIAIEKQKETEIAKESAQKQLIEANHNLGLAYHEKAKSYIKDNELAKARLFNLNALQHTNPNKRSSKGETVSNLNSNPIPIIFRSAFTSKKQFESVAFSPDGTKMLSGSFDGTIHLWSVETGKELKVFRGHNNQVNSIAFSPDGTKIVSGSRNETICLWSVETGKELKVFRGHTNNITSVAFSPDGTKIVSGSWDTTVRLWSIETGEELKVLEGHSSYVTSVAFSPDGTKIVSGSYDETIRLWSVETGKELKVFKGHSGYVTSVAFSPDGTKIVSGSSDKTARLWSAETSEELKLFKGHTNGINSVAFSTDGTKILSGSSDKTICLWSVETGEELKVFRGHKGSVTSVSFSPDGTKILSSAQDNKTILLWNVETGKELKVFKRHEDFASSVAFSPDGTKIVSGSWDNTIRLWSVETGEELIILTGHSEFLTSVAFSPDGTKIVSGSEDRTIRLWNATLEFNDKNISKPYIQQEKEKMELLLNQEIKGIDLVDKPRDSNAVPAYGPYY